MAYLLEVKYEAKKDIVKGAVWYRNKSAGLDEKFITRVEEAIERIMQNPDSGTKFYKNFRQSRVQKFPYIIIYETEISKIIIYQVFNTWQNPRKKLAQLKK
jgi:plasmid stabilization system protein ParE